MFKFRSLWRTCLLGAARQEQFIFCLNNLPAVLKYFSQAGAHLPDLTISQAGVRDRSRATKPGSATQDKRKRDACLPAKAGLQTNY